eukprot:CAMPEP_0171245084 /NCGR_PEP_ID=MMETSP0790-20130122/47231_1 /TAXON_ID=2925 /ORGANISM="Alexandrium catenella, Strain OF101" /LENGTH=33 /DNA_ID= /DNA_START= /DNA_END= /DNA_ORIENTATION=
MQKGLGPLSSKHARTAMTSGRAEFLDSSDSRQQ